MRSHSGDSGPITVVRALLSTELAFSAFILSSTYKATALGKLAPFDVTILAGMWVALSAIGVLIRRAWDKTANVGVVLLVGAFLVWLAATTVWSVVPGADRFRPLASLALVFLAFAVGALVVAEDPQRSRRLMLVFVGFGFLLSLISFNLIPGDGGLDATILSNRIARGVGLALATQASLCWALLERSRPAERLFGVIAALLFLVGVLASGTRQALGGCILAVIITTPALVKRLKRPWLVGSLLVSAIVVVSATVGRSIARDLETINRLEILISGRLGASGEARVSRLHAALTAFGEHPLLGHGVGSFGYSWGVNATDHPHNVVAEVLYDGGLVGISEFVVVMIAVGGLALRHTRGAEPAMRSLILGWLAIVAVGALVSSSVVQDRLLWGVLGCCAIGVRAARVYESSAHALREPHREAF